MLSQVRSMLNMKIINLIHVFITGIVLVYIGYKKQNTPKWAYNLLYVLSALIILLVSIPSISLNYWSMVKIIHYLIILPLFVYVAYYKNLSNEGYNGLMGLGLVVIFYHAYKFLIRLNN